MQNFTLATALVANVAMAATKNYIDLAFADNEYGTLDVSVDWTWSEDADKIETHVSGNFEFYDIDFSGDNGEAEWFFCWNDTNQCYVSEYNDKFTTRYGVNNISQINETYYYDWYVRATELDDEWEEVIENDNYDADRDETELRATGWSTVMKGMTSSCDDAFHETVQGMDRKGTIGVYYKADDVPGLYQFSEVTIAQSAASADQMEENGYAGPGEEGYKEGCFTSGWSEDLQYYLDGVAAGRAEWAAAQEPAEEEDAEEDEDAEEGEEEESTEPAQVFWGHTTYMKNSDGDEMAQANIKVGWKQHLTGEDGDDGKTINIMVDNVDSHMNEEVMGEWTGSTRLLIFFCWNESAICHVSHRYRDGTGRISQYVVISEDIRGHNSNGFLSYSEGDEWWAYAKDDPYELSR